MAARTILQLGNSALWTPSALVEDPRSPAVRDCIADLSDTLQAFRTETGFGRAIAAPQIDRHLRIVFVRIQPTGFCDALVNPEVVGTSSERFELWDDCFSFPDLMVRVERWSSIRVRYTTSEGSTETINAEGDLSELLQHEIDHLDGILAVDRATSPQGFMTRAEWVRQRRQDVG